MATETPTNEKKRVTINNEVNAKEMSISPDDYKADDAVFERIEDDADSVYPQIGATVVIDSGTYNIRCGLSGAQDPSHIIDTAEDWNSIKSINEQPIIYGDINKWDYIQKKWLSIIEEQLNFDTTEHALILTEPYDISKKSREKLTEIIFEEIQCPAFYVSPSSLFSLYSTGRLTGCVLDFAYDCSRIVPIYEGYVLQFNSQTIKIGGQHISSNLAQNLEKIHKISEKYNLFNISNLEDIKRKYVAIEGMKVGTNKIDDIEYELPDGQILKLSHDCVKGCCDILFDGLVKNVIECIMKCDKNSYQEMYNNVIVCGGTSEIDGVTKRIKRDLEFMKKESGNDHERYSLHVTNPKDKVLSSWIGASIFSSLSTFSRALITIKEYEECGSRIVHHKCF